jgi:hypothetical protein
VVAGFPVKGDPVAKVRGTYLRPSKWGPICRASTFSALAVGLPQHADEHRQERPVLLAVDQQLSLGSSVY